MNESAARRQAWIFAIVFVANLIAISLLARPRLEALTGDASGIVKALVFVVFPVLAAAVLGAGIAVLTRRPAGPRDGDPGPRDGAAGT